LLWSLQRSLPPVSQKPREARPGGPEAQRQGVVASLARPGGNVTGVSNDAGIEIWGKRLQILKETVPSASRVAYLAVRESWEGAEGQELRETSHRLDISLIGMPLQEATALEFQRVFTSEVVPSGLEALIVSAPAARGRTVS
jgi:putative ABC transport system substrate-binding protein